VLTIGLAVALAILGVVAVLAYVSNADQRAVTGLHPISVLVAKTTIPAGTNPLVALRAHELGYEPLPAKTLPTGFLRSIPNSDTKLVTSGAIGTGQLLLQSMLVPKSEGATTLGIPTGKMAVSIQVCLSADVAGYVQPGAKVAIFNTIGKKAPLQYSCTSHEPPAGGVDTTLELPNVQVLSVQPAPSQTGGSTSSTPLGTAGVASTSVQSQGLVLVTLAVDQSEATKLINFGNSGELSLALLTPSSIVSTATTSSP
jgi:pilus assembly protein CpaB